VGHSPTSSTRLVLIDNYSSLDWKMPRVGEGTFKMPWAERLWGVTNSELVEAPVSNRGTVSYGRFYKMMATGLWSTILSQADRTRQAEVSGLRRRENRERCRYRRFPAT